MARKKKQQQEPVEDAPKSCPRRKVDFSIDQTKVADAMAFQARKVKAAATTPVRLCARGDEDCASQGRHAKLPPVSTTPNRPPRFDYTQPDAIRAELGDRTPTSEERAAYGCRTTESGRGFTGENAFGVKDPFCGGGMTFPCSTDSDASKDRFGRKSSSSCPVQLIWKGGDRYLRFCDGRRKAGRLLPVSDPKDALKKARAACKHWSKNLSWDGYKPLQNAKLGGLR